MIQLSENPKEFWYINCILFVIILYLEPQSVFYMQVPDLDSVKNSAANRMLLLHNLFTLLICYCNHFPVHQFVS